MQHPIVIVGAGAAGIGMGVLLKRLGLPFVIIEQGNIGESFLQWPDETRFISPSFTGNAFGLVDLNAVTPDTSPAFSLRSEHPTGEGYAFYLKSLAGHFELPIKTGVKITSITHDEHAKHPFTLETSTETITADYVIWAAGEFQYPNREAFQGAELCTHYADIDSWADVEGDAFNIIGGYESGADAAFQLARLGKKVRLFDAAGQLKKHGSDSSYFLSPFTRDRFRTIAHRVDTINARISSVEQVVDVFELKMVNGKAYSSPTPPINCTGFSSSLQTIKHLFDFESGEVKLSNLDESTRCPNLFLTGPQVKHDEALFCFIYKFRQRFAIIGEALSERLNGNVEKRHEIINYYRDNQFYLDDLSCCEGECEC